MDNAELVRRLRAATGHTLNRAYLDGLLRAAANAVEEAGNAQQAPGDLSDLRLWNMVPDRTRPRAVRFGFSVGRAVSTIWTGSVDHADLFRVLVRGGLIRRDKAMEHTAARRAERKETTG
jgi:hypothetical protein